MIQVIGIAKLESRVVGRQFLANGVKMYRGSSCANIVSLVSNDLLRDLGIGLVCAMLKPYVIPNMPHG